MKPISPIGLGLMFFCFFNIIFDELKEPAAGGKINLVHKFLAQTSAEISPPNHKSWLRPQACY